MTATFEWPEVEIAGWRLEEVRLFEVHLGYESPWSEMAHRLLRVLEASDGWKDRNLLYDELGGDLNAINAAIGELQVARVVAPIRDNRVGLAGIPGRLNRRAAENDGPTVT